MNTYIALFRSHSQFVLLLLLSPIARAELKEPPLECEISRGAWCIVKGIVKVEFATIPGSDWNRWTVIDKHWQKQVGVVFEKISCLQVSADTVEVTQVRSTVRFEGALWREAVVKLTKDGRCTLRLLVPSDERSFQQKAASSLSGSIAACMRKNACTDNILSRQVYPFLK